MLLEHFRIWLDSEIEKLERKATNNLLKAGEYSEAIRIRQKLCEVVARGADHETIDRVAGEICDRYCRFPEAYDDNDRMIEERCEKCPLDRLVK